MGGKCCRDGFQRRGAEPGSLFSLTPGRRTLTGEVWLLDSEASDEGGDALIIKGVLG